MQEDLRQLEGIDARILAAHEERDQPLLSTLYREAALVLEAGGDTDAACFYFTQAYVFALEAGRVELADDIWQRLSTYGREN